LAKVGGDPTPSFVFRSGAWQVVLECRLRPDAAYVERWLRVENGPRPLTLLEGPLEITEKNGLDQQHRDAPKSLWCTLRARAFREQSPAEASRVLFLDNYDYLDRRPKTVNLKIYENPTGDIKRLDFSKIKLVRETAKPHVWPNAVQDLPGRLGLV